MAPMEENLQRGIIKQAEKEEGLNRNLKHNTRLKFQGGGLKMKALKIKNWYRRAKKNGENLKKMLQNLRFSPSKGLVHWLQKGPYTNARHGMSENYRCQTQFKNKQNPANTGKVRDKGLGTIWDGSSRCHFRNAKTNGTDAFEIVRENNVQPRAPHQLSHQSQA